MKKDHIMAACEGFTLIELLIAVFIMAVTIPAMVSAFYPIFQSVKIEEEILVISNQVLGTLNRISTIDYAT
ncbi:MAG: type II secretion system protein, partial [Deltaproteobacteria bacterium]|nr:type II secretion system protein [Deltaproteobacteria bacterium]